jgi:hypothetical protein
VKSPSGKVVAVEVLLDLPRKARSDRENAATGAEREARGYERKKKSARPRRDLVLRSLVAEPSREERTVSEALEVVNRRF